jgi:hypothetical protein
LAAELREKGATSKPALPQNNKTPTHRTPDTLVEYESMFLFFRGHMGLHKVYPYHWYQDLQIGMFKPNYLEGVS